MDERKRAGYAKYLERLATQNQIGWNGSMHYTPMPMAKFKYPTCVLCRQMVVDDPFGHSAEPLASGRCCTDCNDAVIQARVIEMIQTIHPQKKSVRARG